MMRDARVLLTCCNLTIIVLNTNINSLVLTCTHTRTYALSLSAELLLSISSPLTSVLSLALFPLLVVSFKSIDHLHALFHFIHHVSFDYPT